MSRSHLAALKCGAAALALGTASLLASPAFAQASASNDTTGFRYDKEQRLTGTILPDPDGAGPIKYGAVRNSYDASGRLTKVEKGELAAWQSQSVEPKDWASFTTFSIHQQTDIVYDAMGRKLREKLSSGGVDYALTQYKYDEMGRVECTAQRMNVAEYGSLPASACTLDTEGSFGPDRITRTTYEPGGKPEKIQRAYGTPKVRDYANYTYTLNGKLATVIEGSGALAAMTYDGHDRLSRWTFPSATNAGTLNASDYEEYDYDAAGNRTSLRKRDGQSIAYSYDALSRMTAKNLPGTAADVTYTYDLRGLQLGAIFTASSQGVTNGYDNAGRLTSSSTNMGGTARALTYAYDPNGNRTRITHPDTNYFVYDYDGLNRVSFIRENGAMSGAGVLAGYTYNAQGNRTALARGNGTSASYGYDGVSRLTSLGQDLSGTINDVSWTFSYNPAGQITSRIRDNDFYALTALGSGSTAYAPNGLNRYSTVAGTAYLHDDNGNLTWDGTKTYAYDVENRLTSHTASGSTFSYGYDPLGRLWSQTGSSGTTELLYDGDSLVSEYTSGSLANRYVHGPGTDERLAWYYGAPLTSRNWFHTDHQGSIVIVSNGSGVGGAINAYDEYGVPKVILARFAYTGQMHLTIAGLYHYKARAYSPYLGRFMQTDPVGYDDQVNLYAYVGNDPFNRTDPTGMATEARNPDGGSWRGCGSLTSYDSAGCSGSTLLSIISSQQSASDSSKKLQKAGKKLLEAAQNVDDTIDSIIDIVTDAADSATITPDEIIESIIDPDIPSEAYETYDQYAEQNFKWRPGQSYEQHKLQNKDGDFPPGGRYISMHIRQFDWSRMFGPQSRERLIVDTNSGKAWYTPDHYRTLHKLRR